MGGDRPPLPRHIRFRQGGRFIQTRSHESDKRRNLPGSHRRPRQGCLGPRHATRRRGEHQEVRRVRVARGEVTGTRAGLWPSRALEREVPNAPQADEEGDRAPGTSRRPGAGAAGAPLVPRG